MAVPSTSAILKRLNGQRRNPALKVGSLASALGCGVRDLDGVLAALAERGLLAVWPDRSGVRWVAVLPEQGRRKAKRMARAAVAEHQSPDLTGLVDQKADDPAAVVEALEEIRLRLERQAEHTKAMHAGGQARKVRSRIGDDRLREPSLVLVGRYPWPPPLALNCPVCDGRHEAGVACLWCDGRAPKAVAQGEAGTALQGGVGGGVGA